MFSGHLNHKLVMHSSEISFGVLSMKCSTFWNVSRTLRAENINILDDLKVLHSAIMSLMCMSASHL